MAVSTLVRSESAQEGLQVFDARHHLRGVAELVGAVFSDELDASGRSILQEMQLVGRLSPFLGGVLSFAFFDDFVSGYVWVEGGRVVGNVTLQKADYTGIRWRISNVAVAPKYRERGIARTLMLATLREIARRGGSWTILQVRTDNPVARRLYEQLGFTDVCRDGVWRLPTVPDPLPEPDPEAGLQRLRTTAWQARLELAQAARSELAHWASALDRAQYQADWGQLLSETLAGLIGLYRVERWGAWGNNKQLLGAVESRANGTGGLHSLRFAVRPGARGKLENVLVAQGLRSLSRSPQGPVIAEHSGDHAEGVAALEAAGFRPQRVLLTMRRLMIPADTELNV